MIEGEIIKFKDFILHINKSSSANWGFQRGKVGEFYEVAFCLRGAKQGCQLYAHGIYQILLKLRPYRLRKKKIYCGLKLQPGRHAAHLFYLNLDSTDRDLFINTFEPIKHMLLKESNLFYGHANPKGFHLNPFKRCLRSLSLHETLV